MRSNLYDTGSAPKLIARKLHTYRDLPAETQMGYQLVGLTHSGKLLLTNDMVGQSYFASITNEADAQWSVSKYVAPRRTAYHSQPSIAKHGVYALIPNAVLLLSFLAFTAAELASGRPLSGALNLPPFSNFDSALLFCLFATIATLVSVGITIYICRQRGLAHSTTLAWALSTVLLGLAGPLTVVAIYPPRCWKIARDAIAADALIAPNANSAQVNGIRRPSRVSRSSIAIRQRRSCARRQREREPDRSISRDLTSQWVIVPSLIRERLSSQIYRLAAVATGQPLPLGSGSYGCCMGIVYSALGTRRPAYRRNLSSPGAGRLPAMQSPPTH